MLTFEKVLEVFQAYLDDDPLYEVVQTSHGYTLMAWESQMCIRDRAGTKRKNKQNTE